MKIVLHLMGGLGNQLFQLATAMSLYDIYNADELVIDLKAYQSYNIRNVEIKDLNYPINIKFCDNYSDIKYKSTTSLFHLFQALYKRICHKKTPQICFKIGNDYCIFTTNRFKYIPQFNRIDRAFMWGYFQEYDKLPSNDRILELFKDYKTDENISNIIEKSNSVAISVRCGNDYLKLNYPICDSNYYLEAIKYIDNYSEETYFVFSDDYDKAKKILPEGYKYIYIENQDPVAQLLLMAKCQNFIISNSTFSWWGAFLGKSTSKIVIVPKKWDRIMETEDTGLLYDRCVVI